jgi:bifunctional DNA-binding transcriptional regulator/antitoxin component of YhaV-PrlF toxin-antitoxin module
MMRTSVASNDEIVVPGDLAERLGFRPGDSLDATIESGKIVLFPQPKAEFVGTIIEDPLTGLPVLDFGLDAPALTCEQVRQMLVDFP